MNILKGYKMYVDANNSMEVLFAEFNDGSIKKCIRKFSTTFFKASDKWSNVDSVDTNAKYIGKYRMNKY